ncbi:MAG: Fic family protein [Planctomycetes bacterium]|nr:Fic family protein [Planctomycetota bacterium]
MTAVRYHSGKFPPASLDLARLLPLIGPANAAVARYEGVLHGIPNTQVLLSPITSQEAVLSSRIEGTIATLGEVLEFEAEEKSASGEKRNDILEILNYRAALRSAMSDLEKLPICMRLVSDAHRVLMQGVRGKDKTPGKVRRRQNLIGSPGDTEESARFVPPNHTDLPDLLKTWEQYINNEKVPDKLIQLAIIHAEFEAIHPFLDGNGRLGRLLVPLFMVSKELLSTPCFFVSRYLDTHRDEYCDRLLRVSSHDDWTGWCEFFLKAIQSQAEDNEAKAKAIHTLYATKKDWITEQTHSQYAVRALDWFFGRPIFKVPDFVDSAGIPEATAKRIVKEARDGGLLTELRPASGRRAAILALTELMEIAER